MSLIFDILFGAIGSAYLLYARRQYDALTAIAGFALCIFPYFTSNAIVTVVVGAVLCAAPFVLRRFL